MTEVVLDKSYLDGAGTAEVRDLCDRYTVVMPQEIFFEMLTTSPKSQQRCFAKLPDRDSPVVLLPPAGLLLDFERRHHEACVPLSRHRVDRSSYAFNRRLRDGTLVPGTEDSAHIAAWESQVDSDTKAFMDLCLRISDIFPEFNGLRETDLRAAVETARQKISTNLDFVRRIYGAGAPPDAPRPERIGPRWASLRVYQCRILSALRLFARYEGVIPQQASAGFWTRAEHSMLDVYCLIPGCLAGAIATFDDEIRMDFMLLCPDAVSLARGLFAQAEG